jgi:Ner family transcriptional regulator
MDRQSPIAKTCVKGRMRQLRQVGGIAGKALVVEQQRVKNKLNLNGVILAEIDRDYGLPDGTARNTLREPHERGERAIAAVLNTYPHLLWPSRYRPSGQRRKPQDWNRVPTMAQRRNEREAQT